MIEQRIYCICDYPECDKEVCVDETGECGLPITSLMAQHNWVQVNGEEFCEDHNPIDTCEPEETS